MKILWFSHLVPYPAVGRGVLQRSYHLVRELARTHEVHLLAFAQRKLLVDLLGDVDVGLAEARRHLEEYCAKVHFLSIPSEARRWGRAQLAATSLLGAHPYTVRWLRSKDAQAVVKKWCGNVDFDVVHFDTISLAPYRHYCTHSALTLDHHNIESHMMLRRARTETNPVKRAYFWQEGLRLEKYERRVCPEFDLNITCSSLDSDRLRVVAPGVSIAEVPNGVDTNYFGPEEGSEQPNSVVFAGAMSRYANAAAMIFFAEKIWPELKRLKSGVTMDVVGGNPPERLRALAAQDKDFRVHGFVPDVRPFIGKAAVYVCPITDGGGTKLKILDALAMGKAVVAHPIACEGINVSPGVDVIFAREGREFAVEIVSLLDNAKLRAQLSRGARSLAESSYSYSVIGKTLTQAFERFAPGDAG